MTSSNDMLNKIAPDKWKHFFVGIAMGAILQAFLLILIPTHPVRTVFIALLFVTAISYGFELFSKLTGRGHHDVMDAVATIIGGLVGMGFILLLKDVNFSFGHT